MTFTWTTENILFFSLVDPLLSWNCFEAFTSGGVEGSLRGGIYNSFERYGTWLFQFQSPATRVTYNQGFHNYTCVSGGKQHCIADIEVYVYDMSAWIAPKSTTNINISRQLIKESGGASPSNGECRIWTIDCGLWMGRWSVPGTIWRLVLRIRAVD